MGPRRPWWRVDDGLWRQLEPLLVDPPRRTRNPGRRRYPPRACLEGVLYLLYTGLRYVDLPRELGFPSGETCRRRLHEWIERGVWAQALALLVAELDRRGRLDWSRVVVDAPFVDAKKGGDLVERSPVNRGFPSSKYHLAVERNRWPLQVRLGPGNENERAHLLPLIDALRATGYRPGEVWADRGYCSDHLRKQLRRAGSRPRPVAAGAPVSRSRQDRQAAAAHAAGNQ